MHRIKNADTEEGLGRAHAGRRCAAHRGKERFLHTAPSRSSALAWVSSWALIACGGEGTLPRDDPSSDPRNIDNATPGFEGPTAMPLPESGIDEDGELVLDELSAGGATFVAGEISGEWFTYSDGTSAVTPPDHTGLGAVDGEAHVSGQGFSEWGAGVSAYFRSADLCAFSSLSLRARGSGAIVVEVATPATSPPAEGGTCMGQGCFGHFSATITLAPEYQDFQLAFASLTQPSWAQPAELSLARVISINLVAKVTSGPASIDLWLDRLALQTNEAP